MDKAGLTSKIKKCVLFIGLIIFFLFFKVDVIYAACVLFSSVSSGPGTCTSADDYCTNTSYGSIQGICYDSGWAFGLFTCDTSCGGGGGAGWPECPVGQVLYCPQPYQYTCVSMGECRASFPSLPEPGPVVCAGKEELGNLRYLCRICQCLAPPTCQNWTSIYINNCSQAEYLASPRDPDCLTNTRSVTLNLNSSNATQMGFANAGTQGVDIKICNDIVDADYSGPVAYSTTKAFILSTGYGGKKVCARFANPAFARKCAAFIEYAPPSCTLGLTPATATVAVDGTRVLTASLSNVLNGSVSSVTFTSSDISVATVSPASDTLSPYNTTATGVAPATAVAPRTATITASAIMDGGVVRCTDTSVITVPPPPSCSVTGSTSVKVNTLVNYCVTASYAENGAGIWKSPTTSQTWTNIRPVGAVGCSQTSFAQTGTYYVVCNAFGSGGACSGNPWCPWPPVALPEQACSYVDCTANDLLTVNVTPPGAWWQVKDADVTTNGDLISPIPGSCTLPACNPVFGLKGAGGFPGVSAYGGATADFLSGAGAGNAAESPYNWLAASRYLGRTYDYAYFKKQIPDDVAAVISELTPPVTGGTFNSGGAPSRGYIWYHWNGATLGDLTIDGNINLVGSRRVVLMAEGANVTIKGRIQLANPGQGFFMMVVGKAASGLKGDILVDPSVTNIEGIFLAESEFKTGLASTQFNARGSVVAYEGVSLQRNLGDLNSNTPAEVFTYAPDIIATFPSVFAQKRMRWKEVAP